MALRARALEKAMADDTKPDEQAPEVSQPEESQTAQVPNAGDEETADIPAQPSGGPLNPEEHG